MSSYKDFLKLPFQSLSVNLMKALVALFLVKLVVLNGGAAALASLSNYQNFIGILALIVTLSTQTGLTVLSSKNKSDERPLLVSFHLVIICFPIVLLLAWAFSDSIVLENDLLLASDYFALSLLILMPFALNILLVAHQVAFQFYKNIFINYMLVGLIPLFYFLVSGIFSIKILLFTIAIGNWLGFLFLFIKTDIKFSKIFIFKFKSKIVKELLQFGFMSGAIGLMFSMLMIFTRHYLAMDLNIDAAGQWDALFKIGLLFQLLIATPILSTGLPILVQIIDSKTSLIKSFMSIRLKFLLLITITGAIFALILGDQIVLLLYSSDFISISSLIILVIVSECFRAIAGLFLLFPIAKGRIFPVILSNGCFVGSVLLGLFILSRFNAINVVNVSWLYLFGSFVIFMMSAIWVSVLLKYRDTSEA